MSRFAFKMFLKPGFEAEYEKRHAPNEVYDCGCHYSVESPIQNLCGKHNPETVLQDS